MGGAAGHLSHIQENLGFTLGDIKNVLQDVAQGNIEAVEKVDGQNIFFTYDLESDSVKTARNAGDIKRGGMTPEQLMAKFTGHPAEGAFINGFKAINSAVKQLSEKELADIFGPDGSTYVNAEIMYPANRNVINYNGNYIVMHGAKYFGDDPNVSSTTVKDSFAKLLTYIEASEKKQEKKDWKVIGPQIAKLKNIFNGTAYSNFVADLSAATAGAPDSMTLKDYVRQRLFSGPVDKLPLSDQQKEQLVKLILQDDDAPSLRDLKKSVPKNVQKLISQLATKVNRSKVISAMLLPIEKAISDFAIEVLRGMNSFFVGDHEKELQRMRSEVEQSISAIQTAKGQGMDALQDTLEKQLKKLGPLENIASTMEGIVFEYPPGSEQLYKLTGSFAMINQIVGGARRMPKQNNENILYSYIKELVNS